MVGSIGRRLRLVLRQPGSGESTPVLEEQAFPEIEFVAFAEDGRLSGRLRMDTARLSDMLNDHDEYLIEQVLARRIPSGEELLIPQIVVHRQELLLVSATGPRGERELRTRTIARGMVMEAGPYLISGDIHTVAGVEPLVNFRRRRPMVPLTNAEIRYTTEKGPTVEFVDAIVVNREHVEWVQVAEPGAVARDLPEMLSRKLVNPTR